MLKIGPSTFLEDEDEDEVARTVVLGINNIPVCVGATNIDRFRFRCMIEAFFLSKPELLCPCTNLYLY